MSEKIYVDQRVPNDAQPYQKSLKDPAHVNANAQPQRAIKTENDPAFQPSPAAIDGNIETGGDIKTPSVIPVKSSGDLAAGGFSGGNDRAPKVKGLP